MPAVQSRRPFLSLIPMAALALAGISACSANNSERLRPAPDYASPVNTDAWRVVCEGPTRREIIVMESRTATFYDADGTLKTREEFCDENRSTSRIE